MREAERAGQTQLEELAARLLPWFETHARDLPWRRDREPYHVWLSEVMLQQTRAEAVRDYYARFLAALPDIPALAAAEEGQLHKLWEGLGYYSRVRNLHRAAEEIVERHGGVFPSDYAAIRALPGVGDYTAGAVASICFEQPTPAVDGNVLRVLSRLTGDRRCVDAASTRRAWREGLAAVYPPGHCGDFTQALMELGATVCLPNGAPACAACPLADGCAAAEGDWRSLPVRLQKRPRRRETLTVFLLRCGTRWALRRRPARGLLAGLWEWPNVPGNLDPQAALDQAAAWGAAPTALERERRMEHVFTHVEWEMHGVYLQCREMPDRFVWVTADELEQEIALPTAFRKFWDETMKTEN
ncbi:MAG: A/G-specific adenine glycosylase [Oscillospiraceae bacterium]|nr:A/G-specific adenine glycosylase [Oscillospiraceae bacterium]